MRLSSGQVIAFVALILFAGCMSPAQKLEESTVEGKLREGQTQAEVRQFLGQPKRSETGSNGKSLDVFGAVVPKTMPGEAVLQVSEIRSLHVLYNQQGQVERFSYYVGEVSGFGAKFNEPWRAGRPLPADKVSRIKRNSTTYNELIDMFGRATIEGLDVYGYKIMSWYFVEGRNTRLAGGRELFVRLHTNLVVSDYILRSIQP